MISQIVSPKRSEADRWMSVPERGTPVSLGMITWIAERVGRRLARLLLYPITAYFLITAHKARRASYEFLKRARGSAHCWNVFRHFSYFAATILDRIYLLRGEFDRFSVTIHGKELVHRQGEDAKGCVLLGSHLGSFEMLRALGVTQGGFPLKVLMNSAHNQNISRLFDGLNPTVASTVIEPDRPDTLIRARESLDAGSFLGMLGDRVFGADKTTRCNFLGSPATLPAGPILLAAMMHCPVILFFGLYRGGNRYDIYFEHFADEIVLDREHRAEEIQSWMQHYVARLEHYARMAPYNWFNFYSFWDQETPTNVKHPSSWS
jgi:predicted LPLAT superfamily acyltransferase